MCSKFRAPYNLEKYYRDLNYKLRIDTAVSEGYLFYTVLDNHLPFNRYEAVGDNMLRIFMLSPWNGIQQLNKNF